MEDTIYRPSASSLSAISSSPVLSLAHPNNLIIARLQFLTVGALLPLPSLPRHVLKPSRYPGQPQGLPHLFPSSQKSLSFLPDIHFLEKCHCLSMYLPTYIWYDSVACLTSGRGLHCLGRKWMFFLNSHLLTSSFDSLNLSSSCQDISFFRSWFNLGFSNLCLKNMINKQAIVE